MGGQKKRQALKKLQHMRVETVKKSSKELIHDLRCLWYMFVFNEAWSEIEMTADSNRRLFKIWQQRHNEMLKNLNGFSVSWILFYVI